MSAIHTAMVAIAKAISAEGISKSKENKQQGWKFRGVDQAMNAFAPLLAANEVFLRPRFSDRQVVERSTKSGTALFYVTIQGEFTFAHADGSEVTVGPFFGEAMDSGDKATNKAMAIAFKYAMFQTFCVPLEGVTSDDPDALTHEVAAMDSKDADWIAKCDEMAETNTKAQCEALKAEMVADYGANDRVPKRVVEAYRAAYKRAQA